MAWHHTHTHMVFKHTQMVSCDSLVRSFLAYAGCEHSLTDCGTDKLYHRDSILEFTVAAAEAVSRHCMRVRCAAAVPHTCKAAKFLKNIV